MAEAVRWGKRGARINTISPGIVMTPLAKDELSGPRGAGYRRMIDASVARRAGTPDEVGSVAALLMGPDGGFITGSNIREAHNLYYVKLRNQGPLTPGRPSCW
jgi:NAD(P)-dependent dehydrogenase (short-subunit alcohol dehydrogenase family)